MSVTTPGQVRIAFAPVAVESPGGGRIRDKHDPAGGDLVTVSGYKKPIRLHRLAAAAWSALVDAARADGIASPLLLPVSGYRGSVLQKQLWDRALARYHTAEAAHRWVAPPGSSAHESGRAIDLYLGSANDSRNAGAQRQTPVYAWLVANAKRFGFYPYDHEPWHWEYNPPAAGPASSDPSSPVHVDASSQQLGEGGHVLAPGGQQLGAGGIHRGRLDVPDVPALASHRGRGPALTLRWNEMPVAPSEIDVVVHLHGYSRPWLNLTQDIERYSGLDLMPVDGAAGNGRSRPTLTVLPRGHFTGVKQTRGPLYVYTFPALDGSDGHRDGLTRLIQFSLERFGAAAGGPPPRVARLILTAHSGGGAPLLRMLRFHDANEIHVFDALYWDPATLADWARKHLAAHDGALRVFHGPGTRAYSRRLLDLISGGIGGGLETLYRVEASTLGHWEIPRNYGWRMLADASAEVPGATRDAVSRAQQSRVERELEVTHPRARARPGPRPKLTVNNFIALFNGVNNLVSQWRSPGPVDVTPSKGPDLVPQHRDLLVNLRTALILRATSPVPAMTLWGQISPGLETEWRRAGRAGAAQGDDKSGARAQLNYLTMQFVNAAYYDLKRVARAGTDLKAPDVALVEQKFKRAEAEYNLANQLLTQIKALGSELARDDPRLRSALEVAQIVALPGTIGDKLAYARKHGVAVTATDLLSKVLDGTKAMVIVSAEVGKHIYEARRAAAAARGAVDLAKQMEGVAKKFENLAKAGERIGRVATALALIGDGIKFVAALADGDYDEALSAGGDFLVDAAPAAFGADLAGPLAVGVVTVKATFEAMHLAAKFIGWCKDESVREAANAFIATCNQIATRRDGALDLIADCELMLGEEPAIGALAERSANREAKAVGNGLRQLYDLTASRNPHDIGAYGAVVGALGQKANGALSPLLPDDPLSIAQRIAAVFEGANSMATFVGTVYRN